MTSRQKAKQKSSPFLKLRQLLVSLITYLVRCLKVNTSTLNRFLRNIWIHQNRFILVLLLLLFFSILTFAAILPSEHKFEGNVISQEMTFTYNGQSPKRFLQNIRNINNLESEGVQTLTFTGYFQSSSFPQLNKLNSLTIQLPNRKSKLILSPIISANKDKAEIENYLTLTELRLQPKTKVTSLNYDFYRKQLAFSLQPNSQLDPNTLELYLGEQPIKVVVENYSLIESTLPKSLPKPTTLEFVLNPNNKQFKLEISQNNTFYITLANPPNYQSEQWFRDKIETKNVEFQSLDRNGSDLRDDLAVSTILEGKIRMAEQEREIKLHQFLFGDRPHTPLNIQLIRHLEIVDPKGIEARFSGHTQQIQIGLDEDFPVTTIRASWLDGILPRDAIIALFSFSAASVANLLSWLFSNSSRSRPPD